MFNTKEFQRRRLVKKLRNSKKEYIKPDLVEYGKLEELTQSGVSGNIADGGIGFTRRKWL